jgi:hypothetical protein
MGAAGLIDLFQGHFPRFFFYLTVPSGPGSGGRNSAEV